MFQQKSLSSIRGAGYRSSGCSTVDCCPDKHFVVAGDYTSYAEWKPSPSGEGNQIIIEAAGFSFG